MGGLVLGFLARSSDMFESKPNTPTTRVSVVVRECVCMCVSGAGTRALGPGLFGEVLDMRVCKRYV